MGRSIRKLISAPVALVLLTLGVAAPAMERADLSRAPVMESEHEPGSCPAPHDHRICTQVSANHAAAGAVRRDASGHAVRVVRSSERRHHAPDARSVRSTPARAPPAV
jgi:hypothetical protein